MPTCLLVLNSSSKMSSPKSILSCVKRETRQIKTQARYIRIFFGGGGLHTLSISLDCRYCQVKPVVEFLFLFACHNSVQYFWEFRFPLNPSKFSFILFLLLNFLCILVVIHFFILSSSRRFLLRSAGFCKWQLPSLQKWDFCPLQ